MNEIFVIKGCESGQAIQVFDMQGNKVYETILTTDEEQVNIGHLNPGAYFVSTFQNDVNTRFKLVKN
jgi:hypothetical protein